MSNVNVTITPVFNELITSEIEKQFGSKKVSLRKYMRSMSFVMNHTVSDLTKNVVPVVQRGDNIYHTFLNYYHSEIIPGIAKEKLQEGLHFSMIKHFVMSSKSPKFPFPTEIKLVFPLMNIQTLKFEIVKINPSAYLRAERFANVLPAQSILTIGNQCFAIITNVHDIEVMDTFISFGDTGFERDNGYFSTPGPNSVQHPACLSWVKLMNDVLDGTCNVPLDFMNQYAGEKAMCDGEILTMPKFPIGENI